MFSFTSMGGKFDASVNQTKGPRNFRLSGQNYHKIGSLLPNEGSTPKFAQLYIYDTENEVTNRMNVIRCVLILFILYIRLIITVLINHYYQHITIHFVVAVKATIKSMLKLSPN